MNKRSMLEEHRNGTSAFGDDYELDLDTAVEQLEDIEGAELTRRFPESRDKLYRIVNGKNK